jgi:hypothetical protein
MLNAKHDPGTQRRDHKSTPVQPGKLQISTVNKFRIANRSLNFSLHRFNKTDELEHDLGQDQM